MTIARIVRTGIAIVGVEYPAILERGTVVIITVGALNQT
jgi:hypothetical protein